MFWYRFVSCTEGIEHLMIEILIVIFYRALHMPGKF